MCSIPYEFLAVILVVFVQAIKDGFFQICIACAICFDQCICFVYGVLSKHHFSLQLGCPIVGQPFFAFACLSGHHYVLFSHIAIASIIIMKRYVNAISLSISSNSGCLSAGHNICFGQACPSMMCMFGSFRPLLMMDIFLHCYYESYLETDIYLISLLFLFQHLILLRQ